MNSVAPEQSTIQWSLVRALLPVFGVLASCWLVGLLAVIYPTSSLKWVVFSPHGGIGILLFPGGNFAASALAVAAFAGAPKSRRINLAFSLLGILVFFALVALPYSKLLEASLSPPLTNTASEFYLFLTFPYSILLLPWHPTVAH